MGAVAESYWIGGRRRRGGYWCSGETCEVARYIVAGIAHGALTALRHDVFVVPCDDLPAGVQPDFFIADHGVAIMFPCNHFIGPTVNHPDRFADSLRQERSILSDRVAAVMAVATGALNKHDLDIRRG